MTTPERAARHLAQLAQAAAPGTRLGTKSQLRQECAVSVGTFNEALRLTQARKLVEVRPGPGGGLFATDQSPLARMGNLVLTLDTEDGSVADAIRVRDALEQLVVADASWYSSPADFAGYRDRLDAMAEARDRGDLVTFMDANWQLHELLVRVNPNPMLRTIYLTLLEIIRSHAVAFHTAEGHDAEVLMRGRYQVHLDLVDAIAAGDPARLRSAIETHSVEHANGYHADRRP